VAWLTYENGKDTRDIQRAISSLTLLAEQTKRQADATTGQLGVLREQVAEAKKQTKAISQQTTAIKASADAGVKSADAQTRAADISASATRAIVATKELQISGFAAEPRDGHVRITAKPTFVNVGGSSLRPGVTTFALYLGAELPTVPNFAGATKFGGNDNTTRPGDIFFPNEMIEYDISPETAKEVVAGRLRVFVYGKVDYTDASAQPGAFCFAYEVQIKNGSAASFISRGHPAYECSK